MNESGLIAEILFLASGAMYRIFFHYSTNLYVIEYFFEHEEHEEQDRDYIFVGTFFDIFAQMRRIIQSQLALDLDSEEPSPPEFNPPENHRLTRIQNAGFSSDIVPPHLWCPISYNMFVCPTLLNKGKNQQTYEDSWLRHWFEVNNGEQVDPITKLPIHTIEKNEEYIAELDELVERAESDHFSRFIASGKMAKRFLFSRSIANCFDATHEKDSHTDCLSSTQTSHQPDHLPRP